MHGCDTFVVDIERGSDPMQLPVACTLDQIEARERVARWRALWVQGRPTIRRDDGQLVVAFKRGQRVRAELEALAGAEQRCCAFARWCVASERGRVVLRIGSTDDGLTAIASMFSAL